MVDESNRLMRDARCVVSWHMANSPAQTRHMPSPKYSYTAELLTRSGRRLDGIDGRVRHGPVDFVCHGQSELFAVLPCCRVAAVSAGGQMLLSYPASARDASRLIISQHLVGPASSSPRLRVRDKATRRQGEDEAVQKGVYLGVWDEERALGARAACRIGFQSRTTQERES